MRLADSNQRCTEGGSGQMRRDDHKEEGDAPCPVCRLIRVYLLIAVPILFLLWLKPEIHLLKGVDLLGWTARGIGVGLVLLIAWRAYKEYWKGDRP